jgi:N-acetylglucosaminyldiphosphoundecaprenol N-acetyl-beta-D-mannosaminyltransferase
MFPDPKHCGGPQSSLRQLMPWRWLSKDINSQAKRRRISLGRVRSGLRLPKRGLVAQLKEQRGTSARSVALGQFCRVQDASTQEVIAASGEAFEEACSESAAKVVTALHIGGLNSWRNERFASALNRARLVYADGIAIVVLARLAGAKRISRSATTDIGIPIIGKVSQIAGRPARVALVGGAKELAERASHGLVRETDCKVVFTTHGYHQESEWDAVLRDLSTSAPDIVFLGLGSPSELIFADKRLKALPACLVLTCGGWFGFLAGDEPRAPSILRSTGFEWLGRLANDPRRLLRRYLIGVFVFLHFSIKILAGRFERRTSPCE